ncbi:hypothetical protein [uncultured Oscillibacter sp.]|uniref:hypothetical protein n=1 Tax=uncultured Oscillibacter sp. TaxID=876091 RepID=UPI002611C434|nr:hypothetical protein [uncultured Oscillibacter sp.]
MAAEKKKARSSGATPEREGKRGLVYRAGLHFRDYSTTSGPVRQFRATGKAVYW